MDEPMTPAERKAKRARLRTNAIASAERWAAQANRSMKCGGYYYPARHADAEDGCRSDGSTCLCECHDAAVVSPGR